MFISAPLGAYLASEAGFRVSALRSIIKHFCACAVFWVLLFVLPATEEGVTFFMTLSPVLLKEQHRFREGL